MLNLTLLFTVIGVLVGLTNILTQVIKKVTWDKMPSSLLAYLIAEALTLISFFSYMAYYKYVIVWYHLAAAIIVGFLVAYSAMFGFDKLKEIVTGWGILSEKRKR